MPAESRVHDLRRELTDPGGDGPLAVVPTTLPPLLRADPRTRRRIAATFHQDFQAFEDVLRRAKSRRDHAWSGAERLGLLRFLAQGYLITSDVRYYNEFLWALRPIGEALLLRDLLDAHFRGNVDEHGFHSFPLARREDVWTATRAHEEAHRAIGPDGPKKLRIGLMGMPSLYRKYWGPLTAAGHEPGVFYIPSFPEPKRDAILRSRVIPWALYHWHGCPYDFVTLPADPTDPGITDTLKEHRLDIGFHKLGYIIRKNILDGFSMGLINDHWSILPYVRGFSSVHWALLFGHPLGATMHYVDEGVDTGPILTFHTYPFHERRIARFAEIEKTIKANQWVRFLKTVGYLAHGNGPIANPKREGLQYYLIHPELVAYIERRLLPLRPEQVPVPSDDVRLRSRRG
jgi:hypothetical protein